MASDVSFLLKENPMQTLTIAPEIILTQATRRDSSTSEDVE